MQPIFNYVGLRDGLILSYFLHEYIFEFVFGSFKGPSKETIIRRGGVGLTVKHYLMWHKDLDCQQHRRSLLREEHPRLLWGNMKHHIVPHLLVAERNVYVSWKFCV